MSEQEETKKEEPVTAVEAPNVEPEEPAKPEASTAEHKPEESKDTEESKDKKPEEKRKFSQDERRKHHEELRRTYKTSSANVRTDFEALPETDDHDEIRKQVEFYFSDSNLAYDDHMRSRVLGNQDNQYGQNLPVPIKDIHSFKRMRRFQPYSAVVEALKTSTTLNVVGENEDEIRRKTPLEKPKDDESEFGDPSIPRAIYAKGFPEEGRTTQFDIEAFFTPYGPLNSVRLRRSFPDRYFKGSVFVEFETEELQKEFLAIEPKPKFEGHELLIKSKRQYCDEKMDDVKSGKIQSNKRHMNFKGYLHNDNRSHNDRNGRGRGGGGGRGRGRGNGRGGSGGRDRDDRRGGRDRRGGDRDGDRDDWRSRRDDFQKGNNGKGDRRRRERSGSGSDEFGRDTKNNGGKDLKAAEGEKQNGDENGVSKKRSREDEGPAESGAEAKKVKAGDE